MALMNASDFGVISLQTKSCLPLKSKICHEHVLWMADAQESTPQSYDDTAGPTLAQNHHDKQKSRLSTHMPQLTRHGPQETTENPKISVLLTWGACSSNSSSSSSSNNNNNNNNNNINNSNNNKRNHNTASATTPQLC